MKEFIQQFTKIKKRYERKADRDAALICKVGFYGNCPVLKLQKAAWTNDDMRNARNQTGVFFSIWFDEASLKKRRVKYNIHALKMRLLTAYKATSIDFAKEFRKQFSPMHADWPNVSIDFGPLTLMQGWIAFNEKTLELDLLELMDRFGALSPIIDNLMEKRRR